MTAPAYFNSLPDRLSRRAGNGRFAHGVGEGLKVVSGGFLAPA